MRRIPTKAARKTRCGPCGTWAVASICPLCKEPRAIFGLLKSLTDATAPRIANIIRRKTANG